MGESFSVCLSPFWDSPFEAMSEFDDIRPYNDDEVRPTLLRLLEDNEFIDTIIKLKFPKFKRLAAAIYRPLVRSALRREVKGVETVAGFQAKIESYLGRNLDETTSALTTSGLDKLEKNKAYLFVSNHRDIAMDPALVNWVLYQNGFQTLRIAIGDNLLTKPFASDLMRLNKSFIVNRSAKSPRDKLKAAKKLSQYIHHSLVEDKANIWIAQREGRAKDSLDVTNRAIISMLMLNKPKAMAFGDYLGALNIVPVSISYEFDPCDVAKARELTIKAETGSYEKAQHEDVQSIATGIMGQKGRVHVAFGQPFGTDFEDVEAVATMLDSEIAKRYVLQPTNCIAQLIQSGAAPVLPVGDTQEMFNASDFSDVQRIFEDRLKACPEAYREAFMSIYSNPVKVKLEQNAQ